MKKIFSYILLSILILTNPLMSKENSAGLSSLNKSLDAYKAIQLSGDMKKSLDFIYPAVFKITSKEMLLQGFEMAEKSGKMPKVVSLEQKAEALKKYDNGVYALVPYTLKMQMDITPPVPKENTEEYAKVQKMLKNPKEFKSFKSFTLKMLQLTMGADALIDSKEESTLINIQKSGKYLAINEKNAGWKFVDTAPASLAQLKAVLPKDIVNKENAIFSVKAPDPKEQFKAMMEMMKASKE